MLKIFFKTFSGVVAFMSYLYYFSLLKQKQPNADEKHFL